MKALVRLMGIVHAEGESAHRYAERSARQDRV
jgi:hypothetical protein